jgi:hypothetical protein
MAYKGVKGNLNHLQLKLNALIYKRTLSSTSRKGVAMAAGWKRCDCGEGERHYFLDVDGKECRRVFTVEEGMKWIDIARALELFDEEVELRLIRELSCLDLPMALDSQTTCKVDHGRMSYYFWLVVAKFLIGCQPDPHETSQDIVGFVFLEY